MKETALITGAGRGVGLALTKRFLAEGFFVFAGSRSTSKELSALAREYPTSLSILTLDVTDLASIRSAGELVSKAAGSLDLLINNAGVNLPNSRAELDKLDLGDSHLEQTMAVNAFGPLRMVQEFQGLLAKGGRKTIINVTSESGRVADTNRVREFGYCMSKAALNMESHLLQNYLGPQGFRVLAVHPGWVRTDMGGPNADISPEESADGIFSLAAKGALPEGAILVDYRGNQLSW